MTPKEKGRSLTEGPILQTLLLFSLPMLLGNLLQQAYTIADTIIVGKCIGVEALAAVGAAYSLMTFLTSVLIGLCMGAGTSWSISYGASQLSEMRKKIWMSLCCISVAALGILLCSYLFLNPILGILQVPAEITPMLKDYLRIVFAGIIFTFFYNFFAFLLRAAGNSRIPLYFSGVSAFANILLDLWFVYGLHGGIQGAAYATVLSQMVCGIGLMLFVLRRYPELLPKKEERCFEGHMLFELFQYSFLTCMQQSVMNFGILMIQGLVNSFGTVVMAAFAAAVKIDTLAYMPAQEFGNAFSLFLAQNYGAERKERMRLGIRQAFRTAIAFCLAVSAFIFLFAESLMRIFVKSGEEAILFEGVRYLHIEGSCYIGIGCLFLFYGLYRGIEKPAVSLILTVISLGSRVLIAYGLAPKWGVTVIWWAIPIGWLLADLVGLLYYLFVKKELFRYEVEEESFHLHPKLQGILRTLIEAVGTVYEEADKKGVHLEIASQHDRLIRHDRKWTARALVYLLKNAVKYTPPGGNVIVSLVEKNGKTGIEIRDTGIGIPPQDLPYIFQKNFRGRNAETKEGYGIGLYLADQILKKEAGEITCESFLKKGAVFTVIFSEKSES